MIGTLIFKTLSHVTMSYCSWSWGQKKASSMVPIVFRSLFQRASTPLENLSKVAIARLTKHVLFNCHFLHFARCSPKLILVNICFRLPCGKDS